MNFAIFIYSVNVYEFSMFFFLQHVALLMKFCRNSVVDFSKWHKLSRFLLPKYITSEMTKESGIARRAFSSFGFLFSIRFYRDCSSSPRKKKKIHLSLEINFELIIYSIYYSKGPQTKPKKRRGRTKSQDGEPDSPRSPWIDFRCWKLAVLQWPASNLGQAEGRPHLFPVFSSRKCCFLLARG